MSKETVDYQAIETSMEELNKKTIELESNIRQFRGEANHFGEAGDAVAGAISGVAIAEALNKVATQVEDFASKCRIMRDLMRETITKYREQEDKAASSINSIINN